MRLNYHHLYYFWTVARLGHLTRAAEQLHVSQSALSAQIRKLEDSLGHSLFIREGRSLKLSEAGRKAYSYAGEIFRNGEELTALFASNSISKREQVKIGAVATLSRNFQEGFLRPLLGHKDIELSLVSGHLEDLLRQLSAHRLDLVLSNQAVRGDESHPWRSRRLARQSVSMVGPPGLASKLRFPEALQGRPIIVPGQQSNIRYAFDQLCEYHKVTPIIQAEVDDMALMRLLSRDTGVLTILPPVVVRDELHQGLLVDYGALPGVYEEFYALSVRRQFEPRLITQLLSQPTEQLLMSEFVQVSHPTK